MVHIRATNSVRAPAVACRFVQRPPHDYVGVAVSVHVPRAGDRCAEAAGGVPHDLAGCAGGHPGRRPVVEIRVASARDHVVVPVSVHVTRARHRAPELAARRLPGKLGGLDRGHPARGPVEHVHPARADVMPGRTDDHVGVSVPVHVARVRHRVPEARGRPVPRERGGRARRHPVRRPVVHVGAAGEGAYRYAPTITSAYPSAFTSPAPETDLPK